MQPNYIRGYWGKARPQPAGSPPWHPLAYHALDVAAVADAILERSPRKLNRLASLCDADPTTLRRLLVLLIALHDIGKFSRHFQAKSEIGWQADVLGSRTDPVPGVRHDAIGYAMRDMIDLDALIASYSADMVDDDALWAAVTGHHGAPALEEPHGHWKHGLQNGSDKAARAFASAVVELLPPVGQMPRLTKRAAHILSWTVAGLTVLSDWIGSSETWFRYTQPHLSLAEYWGGAGAWRGARGQADEALKAAGILPAGATAMQSMEDAKRLLPSIRTLSPLQELALRHPLSDGPTLAIVEDVTGSGKTEAALLLAARMMADGRADGLFFALPTMATANAMYERLSVSYRRLFADDVEASLVLAHGRRALHPGFTGSILADASAHSNHATAETASDETATAACAAWIADDRRKAFLAHVGIGTIDQAVLGVLPSRHQSLRLWGLTDRVLVIDEAHSYDAYISREMETLLEFHAALGGSAIVLSATLAGSLRQKLATAFARGLGPATPAVQRHEYPLVTVVSGAGLTETPVASRADSARALTVRRIGAIDDAVAHVTAMAARGACVAWIRNAVDDAIEGCVMLRQQGLEPILLHARFAMGDRLKIEDDVQRLLGKASTPDQRHSVVLVGTQILEQSLDYDVDAMITDLAPVDLVIQRAGRLWRHPHRNDARPIGAAERELLVLSPDPCDVRDRDWYRAISKRAAAVYADHGLIWRGARALFDTGVIRSPDGVRALLAAVYDGDRNDSIPDVLERSARDALGKDMAARSIANANLLKLDLGYGGNNALWLRDDVTPTRLGEPVTVFRLGKIEDGRVVPWSAHGETPALRWALSEVSLRTRLADGVPQPDKATAALVAAAKSDWSTWEQDQPLLVLAPDGDAWRGEVSKDKEVKFVVYSECLGLRLVNK